MDTNPLDFDGEHIHEPDDEMTDADYVAYHLWLDSLPRVEVAHACGHTVSYPDSGGPWPLPKPETVCGERRWESEREMWEGEWK
jgi:hypothetical protein